MVGTQSNTQIVQDLYAAFGRADVPAILAALADDAVIYHDGPPEILPWIRPYRGTAEWGEYFQTLGQTLEFTSFEPQRFVSDGDTVVAIGQFAGRARATGRPFASHWAMEWHMRDGKVVHCRVYEDTAALVSALQPA